MPDIESSIWSEHRGSGDVLVYGIHRGEHPEALAAFVKQTGVSFPVVSDRNNTLGDLAFPPGVGYPFPRDVVVGKDLRVRAIRNSFNVDQMSALVAALLQE